MWAPRIAKPVHTGTESHRETQGAEDASCHPWTPSCKKTTCGGSNMEAVMTSDSILQLLLYPLMCHCGEHLLKAIKITQYPDFNPPTTVLNIFHFKKIKF